MNRTLAKLSVLTSLPVLAAVALFLLSRNGPEDAGTPIVSVGDRSFSVEIAADAASRTRGLSGRDGICHGCAMLFLFDAPGTYGFWMKDMRFAIDIAWIHDGRIVHVERHVPADFPGVLYPSEEATEVLETDAGALDGVGVGDEVRLPGNRE